MAGVSTALFRLGEGIPIQADSLWEAGIQSAELIARMDSRLRECRFSPKQPFETPPEPAAPQDERKKSFSIDTNTAQAEKASPQRGRLEALLSLSRQSAARE